jgi:hypothetical protein
MAQPGVNQRPATKIRNISQYIALPGDCRLFFRFFAGDGEMLLVNTYVAASTVQGVGVFAAEPITNGRKIWRFDKRFDLLIPIEEYLSSLPPLKALLDRYAYPSPDRPGFIVYEADNGRFMNHSETPNTDFSNAGGKAIEDIEPGEEITCNYSDFYEEFELLPSAADKLRGGNSVSQGDVFHPIHQLPRGRPATRIRLPLAGRLARGASTQIPERGDPPQGQLQRKRLSFIWGAGEAETP